MILSFEFEFDFDTDFEIKFGSHGCTRAHGCAWLRTSPHGSARQWMPAAQALLEAISWMPTHSLARSLVG